MTIDQAKSFRMPQGLHKGVEMGSIPLPYLKWVAKNWVYKEVRDAAIMVVNARCEDIGEKPKFKPLYNLKPQRVFPGMELKANNSIDYSQGAFGELKTWLEEAPAGLF